MMLALGSIYPEVIFLKHEFQGIFRIRMNSYKFERNRRILFSFESTAEWEIVD